MNTMKKLCVLLLLFNIAGADDLFIISQNRYVNFSPLVQNWSDDNGATFSEVSFPVSAYIPVNSSLGINFRTNQAETALPNWPDSLILKSGSRIIYDLLAPYSIWD